MESHVFCDILVHVYFITYCRH